MTHASIPTRLMFTNLHIAVQESELMTILQPFDCLNISIRRFPEQGTASALASFPDVKQTSLAKSTLLFQSFQGRELQISYFDQKILNKTENNLVIKNLHMSVTNRMLYEYFQKFGHIFSSKIMTDSSGNSRGFGYVHFLKEENAKIAISKMDEQIIQGQPIIVQAYNYLRSKRKSKIFHNIFVKNLPSSVTTKEKLDALFDSFGERTSVSIIQDGRGPNFQYFGILIFKNASDALKAIKGMNGIEIEGKKLIVKRALTREQQNQYRLLLAKEKRNLNEYSALLAVSLTNDPLTLEIIKSELASLSPQIIDVLIQKDSNNYQVQKALIRVPSIAEAERIVSLYKPQLLSISRLQGKEDRERLFGKIVNNLNPMQPNCIMPCFYGCPQPSVELPQKEESPDDLTIEQKKQEYGNIIYEIIESQLNTKFAEKITGMLLELDISILQEFIECKDKLQSKVDEAKLLLEATPEFISTV